MKLEEILKAKGLSDEDVQAVIGEMKQNKIFTTSEENLDIRYGKLKGDHDTLTKQHGETTAMIEQLKKGAAGSEELQGTISEQKATIEDLQKQIQQIKTDNALTVALMKANVAEPEFLAFKIREKGEIVLDEHGNIQGIDDTLDALKTQYPNQFVSAQAQRQTEPQKLPDNNAARTGLTQDEFNRMGYQGRLKLKQEQPEIYAQMTGKQN